MSTFRHFSKIDRGCIALDQAVRALFSTVKTTGRAYPARQAPMPVLTRAQRKHSAALMRINHAGEICAQALYQAQGLASGNEATRAQMEMAAIEEGDHLAWCQERLEELGGRVSFLGPFWYAGSFSLGLVAGWIGDQWSLGFLSETEHQVVLHLEHHLKKLAPVDVRSQAVLQQMHADEAKHRDEAKMAGGADLPTPIKFLMGCLSKIMVKTTYWL